MKGVVSNQLARGIAVTLCALQLACNGNTPVAPSSPASTSIALTGRVVEATTGNPVSAANVLIGKPGQSAQLRSTFDEDSAFQITDLEPGATTIVIAKTGYEVHEREVTLTADTSLVFLVVPRRFVLTGRITDIDTGVALPGATITVLDGPNASRTAVAGADGTFSLPELWVGGFTIRVRHTGYDSVFQGIRLIEDTVVDIQMRSARQSLAGTWTGEFIFAGGGRVGIPELTMTHSGATIASSFPAGLFTGTLADPSSIGATTQVAGTLTVRRSTGGRNPMPCDGTGRFNGTVNWTRLTVTAPEVLFACGGQETVTLSLVRQQ